MSAFGKRPFPWSIYWVLLGALVLFAFGPVLSVMAAIGLANMGGCVINEASVHTCMVLGMDLGGLLAFMFIFGWFALVTLPLGLGLVVVWLAVIIIHRIAWGRLQQPNVS